MTEIIIFLYSCTGIIALCGYIPQALRLYNNPLYSSGLSLQTWFIWGFCAIIALLYGLTVLKDPLFTSVAIIAALGHTVIITLIIRGRTISAAMPTIDTIEPPPSWVRKTHKCPYKA